MPELPEVESIRIGLSRILPGKQVASIWFEWPKSFPNAITDVEAYLKGAIIVQVRRRAKVLIIDLDSDYSLVIHLKMTGQLVFIGAADKKIRELRLEISEGIHQASQFSIPNSQFSNPKSQIPSERFAAGHPSKSLLGKLPDKSTRVIIGFSDASKLFFNDQRKFGWMRLLPTIEIENLDFFKRVGPEPLAVDFLARDFIARLRKRPKSTIKAALLDQSVVAGVGNIYADESLWAAKIHPLTRAHLVTDAKIKNLYAELRRILRLSIERGGSTDRNYVNAEGKRGNYLSFASVFRREGQPCPRCSTTIQKIRAAGRGTHICPHCQRLRSAKIHT